MGDKHCPSETKVHRESHVVWPATAGKPLEGGREGGREGETAERKGEGKGEGRGETRREGEREREESDRERESSGREAAEAFANESFGLYTGLCVLCAHVFSCPTCIGLYTAHQTFKGA